MTAYRFLDGDVEVHPVGGNITVQIPDANFIDWDAIAYGEDGAHLHYRGQLYDLEETR